jgi:hypothetical protein
MPMYFFCLHEGDDVIDAEGTDLPDLNSAHAHARQVARELTFRRNGMLERSWSRWTMLIRDDSGEVLLSFRLSDIETEDPLTAGGGPCPPA